MSATYRGPLRAEPIAIELHNTVYAAAGQVLDGLAEPASAEAFIRALGAHLPRDLPPGRPPPAEQLVELRANVRAALHAGVDYSPQSPKTLKALSATAGRAPASVGIAGGSDGEVKLTTHYHGAHRSDIVLAAFAADAIGLLTGPLRDNVHACGAPGCVLLYLKRHPRQRWCSNNCGNRARQARHYRRTHS